MPFVMLLQKQMEEKPKAANDPDRALHHRARPVDRSYESMTIAAMATLVSLTGMIVSAICGGITWEVKT